MALPESKTAIPIFEQALGVQATAAEDGYLLPLVETPIRIIRGDGIHLVLQPFVSGFPLPQISTVIPGVCRREELCTVIREECSVTGRASGSLLACDLEETRMESVGRFAVLSGFSHKLDWSFVVTPPSAPAEPNLRIENRRNYVYR